ncbi:MAG: DNA polymerase III subunit alpha, partial [Sphingobium sp.]
FGDIIALVSLYRPGPMDNIPMFGRRKNGQEDIEYPHDLLEPILKETYGIFVYQEQVMQAAQILAGYSLGDADLLRRAMGKKIKAEMDAQRERFVKGCAASNIKPAKANELFDLIDKFAGYGFNKSHAAAYALLSYQTAWLKAHHPAEFYAASMAFDIHLTEKLTVFVDDMRRMGLNILPPDLNRSEADFTVEPDPDCAIYPFAVRYALGGLKGVGERAMELLVEERKKAGPFKDLDDFANRVEPRLLNRRQIESLAGAGAFDCFNVSRAGAYAAAETILSVAANASDARQTGQGGLFGGDDIAHADVHVPANAVWSKGETMERELEAFGFYFGQHPVDRYREIARGRGARTFGEICSSPISGERPTAVMAALVESIRWRDTRRGGRYVMATFSDPSGQFQASCFEDDGCKLLEKLSNEEDSAARCALLTVELDRAGGEDMPRVTVRGVQGFDNMASNARMRMTVHISASAAISRIASLMAPLRGGKGELLFVIPAADASEAFIVAGRDYRLDMELSETIEALSGVENVTFEAIEARLSLAG